VRANDQLDSRHTMTRMWVLAVALLVGGLAALGCSSTPSATPAPPATTAVQHATPIAWFHGVGLSWNHKLNSDQVAIDAASSASKGANPGTYFAQLASACSRLVADARGAQGAPAAPSAALAAAWHAMTTGTLTYASDCMTRTRTHANSDLATWNSSLSSMNASNASLNTVVAAVRKAAAGASG
jgi:hypothetical protein